MSKGQCALLYLAHAEAACAFMSCDYIDRAVCCCQADRVMAFSIITWQGFAQGLQHWQASSLPFTSNHAAAATGDAGAALDSHLLALIAGAQRGLLVVGELASHADALAAGNTARTLGWPVATDVLSGKPPGLC